jgi:predicted homoserine dehydrogenase-like protein
MNLYHLLNLRAESGKPLRVGLIGAGKFGSMFLAQARRMPGVQVTAVAEVAPERALEALRRCGWKDNQFDAASFAEAMRWH